MKERRRGVASLANLAVNDERTVARTRKVIAQRVEREIDAVRNGSSGVLARSADIDECPT